MRRGLILNWRGKVFRARHTMNKSMPEGDGDFIPLPHVGRVRTAEAFKAP